MSTTTPLMTTEGLLALPEDGMERELIRGELREREMTRRNRLHAANPDTIVGIDVAVFSLDVLRQQTDQTRLVEGVPILAVEILSPNDKYEEVREKIVEYLRTGVKLVWEVDPDFQTVRVFRQDEEPVMFNRNQTLSGDAILPGFEVPVADLFPNWSAKK